jgi:hypothetical protein
MNFNAKAKALENMKKMARDMKSEGFKKNMGVKVEGSNPDAVKEGLEKAKEVVGNLSESEEKDPMGAYSGEHDEEKVEALPENPKLTELVKSLSDDEKMQLYQMLHEEHESKESPEFEAGEHAGEVEE